MTSKEKETQEQVDAALDAALDDLEDDDDGDEEDQHQPITASPQNASRPAQGPVPPPTNDNMNPLDAMMRDLMQSNFDGADNDQADEFLGRLLQEMQSQIGNEMQQMNQNQKSTEKPKTSADTKSQTPKPKPQSPESSSKPAKQQPPPSNKSNNNSKNDVDHAISSLIEGMTNQAKLDEPTQTNEGLSEAEMLKNMMDQLGEGLGGEGEDAGFNADALIDGMMEQLLAKDLMYEPMKKVAERFPDWLEQHKEKLPKEEYDQRCQQYKCFQKLVHTYDTEPENTQLLMLLMQEVQEYGQPPPEIVKDIAPGLELDADGLPIMDGAGGLPFPMGGGGGDEECRIM